MLMKYGLVLICVVSVALITVFYITNTPPSSTEEVKNFLKLRQLRKINGAHVPDGEQEVVRNVVLKTDQIKERIFWNNIHQRVYNAETFGFDFSLIVLVQVHDRLEYLRELIASLSAAQGIDKTLVIFSHDVYNLTINQEVRKIKFCKFMQIFYPFSVQTHTDEFPGESPEDCPHSISFDSAISKKCRNAFYRDTYGHYREASTTQIKHHWWWKANYVFNRMPIVQGYEGLVLLLEEDHYLAPDFIYSLNLMQDFAKDSCVECALFSLGLHNKFDFKLYDKVIIKNYMENFGLAFNRTTWNHILRYSDEFCTYDDYNWDWTLQHVLRGSMKVTPLSMVMSASRVYHIGNCGTHHNSDQCNPEKSIRDFQNKQSMGSLFPKSLNASRQIRMGGSSKPNGGWGDPRDHVLCMAM